MARIEKSPVQEWTFQSERQNLQIKVICENEKIRGLQMRSCRAVPVVDQKQAKRASQKFPILEKERHRKLSNRPRSIEGRSTGFKTSGYNRYNHWVQFNCGKSLLFNIWLDVLLLLNSDVTLRRESLQSLSACCVVSLFFSLTPSVTLSTDRSQNVVFTEPSLFLKAR